MHQHLETPGHAAGEDHVAGGEAEPGAGRFVGREGGEAFELLEEAGAEEELILPLVCVGSEARPLAGSFDARPVDGRGEVLEARVPEGVVGELVRAEGAERAVGAQARVVEFGRLRAVIHGDDEAAREGAGRARDPLFGREVHFGRLAFGEFDSLLGEIPGEPRRRRLALDPGEIPSAIQADEQLKRSPAAPNDSVDGQRVEQFVREDDGRTQLTFAELNEPAELEARGEV